MLGSKAGSHVIARHIQTNQVGTSLVVGRVLIRSIDLYYSLADS